MVTIQRPDLDHLLTQLTQKGYTLIGPTVSGGNLILDEIRSSADLPAGWTDEQAPGKYRLARRDDGALFGHSVGAHSWKRYLFPPTTTLVEARRQGRRIECAAAEPGAARSGPPKYAFIGVTPCELAAIRIQDKVFLDSGTVDPVYKARREQLFIIVAQCTRAAGTCFCASMGTGPTVERGFDIALTEVTNRTHYFVAESGSKRGGQLLAQAPARESTASEVEEASRRIQRAREQIARRLDTAGLRDVLLSNAEHPRWDEVARRCLTCANCTMVCPTCFCSTVDDLTDLSGDSATRVRRWDSCFTMDFSYIHGGCIRSSGRSRYRQWLTHKLASWNDQFGTPGCVGCGRCITWCPVGIDITEEAAAIRAARRPESSHH